MIATRTAKGTVSTKISGTQLILVAVPMLTGDSLVVWVAGETAPDTVVHSGRPLRLKRSESHPTATLVGSLWMKGQYHNDKTGDLVATWGASTGKRTMTATAIDRPEKRDKMSTKSETAEVQPSTGRAPGGQIAPTALVVGVVYAIFAVGTTDWTLVGAASNTVGEVFAATTTGTGTGVARPTLEGSTDLVLAFFTAEGPDSEHGSVTARVDDGFNWAAATLGQKIGTSGGAPLSNIVTLEAFHELTNPHATRAQLQNANSRDWVCGLIALREIASFNKLGITPSDVVAVNVLVLAAGGNIDDVLFGINEDTGEWEAYEGADTYARSNTTGEWV